MEMLFLTHVLTILRSANPQFQSSPVSNPKRRVRAHLPMQVGLENTTTVVGKRNEHEEMMTTTTETLATPIIIVPNERSEVRRIAHSPFVVAVTLVR
jgi:hypothetical protein